MDTNLYRNLQGSFLEKKKMLSEAKREWLENSILNEHYNDFISKHADYKETDKDKKHSCGKRVPYIGWYWRHIEFASLEIPIGQDDGEEGEQGFVGFMARNKWDYPERMLTKQEALDVIAIIDSAMEKNQSGGLLDKIVEDTNKELEKLWDYFSSLKI